MPKIKTHRGAAKRFKRTKSGEFKRHKAFNRHLKTCKSAKTRRGLRQACMLDVAEKRRVEKMLPYA